MRLALTRVVAVILALVLAACASLALRNPPRIDVVGVALDRVEGADAFFRVDLLLTNRLAEDVVVDELQGKLSIEGENIAQAALANAPVRIPANGSAPAEMTAHTGMDAVLHYRIEGSARLAGGARFPFTRSGELGERQP
jgi:hypothetical protein